MLWFREPEDDHWIVTPIPGCQTSTRDSWKEFTVKRMKLRKTLNNFVYSSNDVWGLTPRQCIMPKIYQYFLGGFGSFPGLHQKEFRRNFSKSHTSGSRTSVEHIGRVRHTHQINSIWAREFSGGWRSLPPVLGRKGQVPHKLLFISYFHGLHWSPILCFCFFGWYYPPRNPGFQQTPLGPISIHLGQE
jgi:hypothetical protein